MIPAAVIPNSGIDAYIPTNINAADRKIVRAVAAALPPSMRQYVIWLRVRPGKPGFERLPNNGLIVEYCDICVPGKTEYATLVGLYILFIDGKVNLDSNATFAPGLDKFIIPVMQSFRTEAHLRGYRRVE